MAFRFGNAMSVVRLNVGALCATKDGSSSGVSEMHTPMFATSVIPFGLMKIASKVLRVIALSHTSKH